MPRFQFDSQRPARTPRPYQETCQQNVLASLQEYHQPCLLHLPTGGGKTFVANNVVARFLRDNGGYALWITKDWWLLEQAALDMAQRHDGMARRLRRMGGANRLPCLQHVRLGRRQQRRIVYTTLQTFKRRLDDDKLPRRSPSIIVWDECHWGYAGRTGKALRKWARKLKVPLLGLTATPRAGTEFQKACTHTYHELVDTGHLASYNLETVKTGEQWRPQWPWRGGDFTGESLQQLARNKRRNRMITRKYVDNAKRYGKTVIFACNIAHANKLAGKLTNKGIAARPIHSDMELYQNDEALNMFRDNQVRVLVNVAMMTHGVDVPDIKTVFLCRPTQSDILYSQMVGRGTRLAPGKTDFHLVEFTDNSDRFAHVIHAREFLGTPSADEGAAVRRNRNWKHEFDPGGAPAWTGEEVRDEVKNLWYLEGQTFGVEFELTSDEIENPGRIPDDMWQRKADGLLKYLRRSLGRRKVRNEAVKEYHTPGYEQWKVEYDSSVGWEVVSPVLKGKQGLVELEKVCGALTNAASKLDLRVNYRTGTHVHLGWLADPADAARSILWTRVLEPVLRSLVPPSRFAEYDVDSDRYKSDTPNEYCRPVADAYNMEELDSDTTFEELRNMADDPDDLRYVTLNVTPLFEGESHVEIRLLGGTTEARKLLPWLSLWMRILWAVSNRNLPARLLDDPEETFPNLRIADVLSQDFIGVPEELGNFLERLEIRQQEIFDLWKRHSELTPWLPEYLQDRRRWKPKIAATLLARNLVTRSQVLIRSRRSFVKLSNEAKQCAVWCTLIGERASLRRDDDTIGRVAQRLRAESWTNFDRLDLHGQLACEIKGTLNRATRKGNDWLDIPRNTYVQAYYTFEDMGIDVWHQLVIDALTGLVEDDFDDEGVEDGWVTKDRLVEETFRITVKLYRIRRNGERVTRMRSRIKRKIVDGIHRGVADGCICESTSGYSLP